MNINRQILRLTLPAIVSNITVPLLGLCDTSISGHLGSTDYLGAIAVGTMGINAIFWCMGFLRMGTTGLTAQAYGADDNDSVKMLFTRALLLGLLLGTAIVILRYPLQLLIMWLIGADPAVRDLAAQYFRIVIAGAPAQLATMAISGWFLGMQTSVQPMVIAIVTNIVNIVLSLCFVFILGMGFAGTATGTLTANWIGLILALFLVWKHQKGKLPITSLTKALHTPGWSKFFSVNIFIFLRSFCIMAVTMGVTSYGARLGTATLAANTVIMQFFIIFSHFMDGFAFAGEALTGKAVGKHDPNMLSRTVTRLIIWGLAVTAGFILLYTTSYRLLSEFITDNRETLDIVYSLRIWIWLLPLASGAAFIFDGIFIGLTSTASMLISTALGLVGFYLSYLWLPIGNEDRLWLAFVIYLLLRGLTLITLYKPASHRQFC